MSSSLNHAVYIQIKTLVQSLSNKKSLRNAKTELLSLIEFSGPEARKYMLMCIFDSLDFKDQKVQSGTKEQTKTQFLVQQLTLCSTHSNFLDYFTQVIEHSSQKQNLTEYMNDVIKCLKLALPLQITMILSLALSPTQNTAKEGLQMLKTKLIEYFELGKPLQFSENILSSFLYVIKNNPELEDMSEEVKFLIETNGSDKPYEFKPLFVKGLENTIVPETRDVNSLLKFSPQNIKPCELLQDLGPSCTQSLQSLTLVFSEFPEIDEEAILEVLLMIHNSQIDANDEEIKSANFAFQAVKSKLWSNMSEEISEKKANISWNVDNFIKYCSDRYPNTKWAQVIKHLDRQELIIQDSQCLINLFKCFQKFKKFATFNFPSPILFERWKNPSSQADFLIKLIQGGQPDAVLFNECPKRLVSLDLYPNLKISSLNPPMLQFFSCLDFLEILIELSESDYYTDIRTLFDLPVSRCPDLLILGLVQIKPKTGMPLLDELLSHLLPLYLSNHASSMEILEAIWRINPQVMISAFSELYKRDNSSLNLSRVLDISQEIKDSLLPIVNCRDYSFSVSLGILAAKRDFLHLDQWIAKRIRSIGNPFITAIFKYLDEHIFEPCRNAHSSQFETVLERSQLSLESLVIIFQTLMNPHLEGKMSPRNKLLLTERYKELAQYFPNIISDSPWTEIESTANSLFEQTFEEKLSIPELIETMLKYKRSNNEKEKNILLCMMTNLLDEARFFSNYKYKILMIMAQIYGAVINNNLVEGQARDVTFKIIVESMKHKDDRKQLEFGVNALNIFKGRLHEWPTKAVQLFSVENLREYYLELLEEIRYSLEAKGIQLDLPPDYLSYANMRSQEKNRAMTKPQAHLYPPQTNQTRIAPPMSHEAIYQDQMKGGMGFDNRSPLLNPMQQNFPPQAYDAGAKNVTGRFSTSKIEEMSSNFRSLNTNLLSQPGVGNQPGQPILPMGQGTGFAGFGGLNIEGLRGQTTATGAAGLSGFGGFRLNESLGNSLPLGTGSFGQGIPPQSGTPGLRENESQNAVPQIQPQAQRTQPLPPYMSFDNILKSYDKDFTDIPEEWKNKLTFSLNNCSNSNIDEKANEIKGYIGEEKSMKWFSKYIVYQRAPLESNFHSMYINLVSKIGKKEIFAYMIKETYALLNQIITYDKLFNEKAYIQGNDKNNLKNLGSWLGLLTIGRNKPIVMKDFDLKTLIIEGYENQKLDYMLPLVCKILNHGAAPNSVFKPKNAWMNALLALLTEISQMPELKMTLKCEVQVLLNNFGLTEDDIIPSKILHNRKIQSKNIGQRDLPNLKGENRFRPFESQLTINELPQYVTVDQNFLAKIPELKDLVAQALDRAIKDILPPVISRSVTIALITTKELVFKDFALEPDEKKLLKGAMLLLQNLAGNLALVTCREPLKIAYQHMLKVILEQNVIEGKLKEEIIHGTSVDNLDLGCALIKKAVIETSLDELNEDQSFVLEVIKRRRFRDFGEPFYDESVLQIYSSLPPALRPNMGGITKDQLKIYEEFGKTNKAQEPKSLIKTPKDEKAKYPNMKLDPESAMVVQRFEQYIFQLDRELETFADQQNNEKFKELQAMHKRAMEMIHNHGNYEEVPIECAIKILEPFFNDQFTFKKINFFLAVLKDLKSLNETLPNEILHWVLSPTEKHIYKPEIVVKLIKDNFINVPDLDQAFAEYLDVTNTDPRSCFNILIKIIKVLVVDEKLLDVNHFQVTIDKILKNHRKLIEFHPRIEAFIDQFVRETKINFDPYNQTRTAKVAQQPTQDSTYKSTLQEAQTIFKDKDGDFYNHVYNKLEEWLKITSESEMPSFIKVIETNIFQAGGEKLKKFFAYMTDICVSYTLDIDQKMKSYGALHHNPSMDFSYIDTFSKLVILLLKTVIETNKNEILEGILQSIVLTLTKNHESQRGSFNQRPFWRLFYNILFDINRKEYDFTPQETTSFLGLFIKIFDKLQPLKYPGFTFAWLDLICNRNFATPLLSNPLSKTEMWKGYVQLFINLFKFFKETIEGDHYKTPSYKLLVEGVTRYMLIVLKEYPEFFVEAGFFILEYLPEQFVQIKNIILSGFPKGLMICDPFNTPENFEQDLRVSRIPIFLYNFEDRVINAKLHEEFVKYLTAKNDANEIYFRNICSKFLIKDNNVEIKINQPVVNAFVLFVPWMIFKSNEDTQKIKEWKMTSYNLFWKLLISSNNEMRETLLNSIINQLTFPNPITFYFANFILNAFSQQNDEAEALQDQIIKIFIERLVAARPHSWGLLYTFYEVANEILGSEKKFFTKNPEINELIRRVCTYVMHSDRNPM